MTTGSSTMSMASGQRFAVLSVALPPPVAPPTQTYSRPTIAVPRVRCAALPRAAPGRRRRSRMSPISMTNGAVRTAKAGPRSTIAASTTPMTYDENPNPGSGMPKRRVNAPATTTTAAAPATPDPNATRPLVVAHSAQPIAAAAPTTMSRRTRTAGPDDEAGRGLMGWRKLGRVAWHVKHDYRYRHARQDRILRGVKLRTTGHRSGGRGSQGVSAGRGHADRVIGRRVRGRRGRSARVFQEGARQARATRRSPATDHRFLLT